MKTFLTICCSIVVCCSIGQSNEVSTTFFMQCMIDIERDEAISLESNLRENPYIKLVRLSPNSKTAFLLTQGVTQLTEQHIHSWFGEHSQFLFCINIGVYKIDSLMEYPVKNCLE